MDNISQKLADLGFSNATEVTGSAKSLTTVRIRTSKGWIYHKFASLEQVETWAKLYRPEVQE